MSAGQLPDTAPEPAPRTPWQRWVGFWFPASDPTTLGFIRIATGLLVLYVHLAYTLDLQQFFGKTAWYAQRFVDRERKEYPWQVSPFLEWDLQSVIPARLPEYPHRRQAVVEFIKNLPQSESQRKESLRFIDRLGRTESTLVSVEVIDWFRRMGMSELERDQFLSVLVMGRPAEMLKPSDPNYYYVGYTPNALFGLPQQERERVASEVRAFWDILPRDPTDRSYVLEHLRELSPEVRKSFADFLLSLPQDEEQRRKKIDYLEYWNNEPEKSVRTGHMIFSVWFHVNDPTEMMMIHCGILLVILLFTLGLFTRVTSVLVWLAVVGYIHRTQQVLFGMDTMMNILLFYLMIGNSGAALSLDRLIARYRAVRASMRRTGTIDAATRVFLAYPPPSRSAGFALRLIQIHFCVIYIAAGLSKLKGPAWWSGHATWDVFVNPEFTLLQYEWYEKALRAIVSIKPVYYAMIIGGSWFTLFIEIAGPFLLWTRLRWLIMFLASLMHAIIAVMMGLNIFELLMIVMILAFIPDGVIRDRLRGGPKLPKFSFAYNPASQLSARAAALVVAADADGQTTLVHDPTLGSPVAIDAQGVRSTGPPGVLALFRSLRLLSPFALLARLPGLKGCFTKYLFPAPVRESTFTKPPTPAVAS